MTRKEIKENVRTLSPYELEGSVNSLIELLECIEKNHPEYSSFKVDWDPGRSKNEDGEFYMHGIRLETDEEFERRKEDEKRTKEGAVLIAAKRKQRKEEKDVKEYARLKKKFGDNKGEMR
jgi:hypothetical protein